MDHQESFAAGLSLDTLEIATCLQTKWRHTIQRKQIPLSVCSSSSFVATPVFAAFSSLLFLPCKNQVVNIVAAELEKDGLRFEPKSI
jgi:hypothetical protein